MIPDSQQETRNKKPETNQILLVELLVDMNQFVSMLIDK